LAAADSLEADGIGCDVVSMPCWEAFDAQDAAYKADILPEGVLRVSVEAGVTLGWERYTGLDGLNFGVDSFGASAPIDALYSHFGLTGPAIAAKVKARLA
jgi:transketolase